MALLSFLVLLLFLATSQFYTPFFVELGLVMTLCALLLLPSALILLTVFSARNNKTGGCVQVLSVTGKIVLAQLIYLLSIYLFLLTIKGFGFLREWGFWMTYIENYRLGYVHRSLQDLLVSYGTTPVLISLISSLISAIAISWMFYWFKRLLLFMRK